MSQTDQFRQAIQDKRRRDQAEEDAVAFWDCDDGAEILEHRDQGEAIAAFLDQLGEPGITPAGFLKVLEALGELEVFGYRLIQVTAPPRPGCLEDLLERLDEEYGDPGGNGTEASPAMKAAEAAFVAAVIADFEPWACERFTSTKIDPVAWVRENCPEWIEPEKIEGGTP